jgi:hypothetical protein
VDDGEKKWIERFIIIVLFGLALLCWLTRSLFGIPWPEWLPQ